MIEILIIEDHYPDSRWMEMQLDSSGLKHRRTCVRDGEEALRFLRRDVPYTNAPTPDLIFLDINLPKIDGLEVLREMKADERLRDLPVCVVSGSNVERADVVDRYKLSSDCYRTKPLLADQICGILDQFDQLRALIPELQKPKNSFGAAAACNGRSPLLDPA